MQNKQYLANYQPRPQPSGVNKASIQPNPTHILSIPFPPQLPVSADLADLCKTGKEAQMGNSDDPQNIQGSKA